MARMKNLNLDLETFSDVDLAKCGVYKYASSPAFQILLFGYSVDHGPVVTVDLACGEELPEEILAALTDQSVVKWAFNCMFERICISTYLRKHYPELFTTYSIPEDTVRNYLDPASWHCSMVWSAYRGLPLSLASVGAVLGLEDQKMTEGKDLIRFFCMPRKSDGGRNLPSDAPDKWAVFKSYNIRDVEVEISIQERLQKFPVPESVWTEYAIDQEINDRGVMVDMKLVKNAIAIDELTHNKLMNELTTITGLDNPNSVQQMKEYLAANGLVMDTLGKKAVREMVKTAPEDMKTVLELRQETAKSSIKKFQTMERAACSDDRVRGMFQFFGAPRTGRFAGRLVQLQNLKRNDMPDLAEARALVKEGNYAALELLYDSVPEVLSELIRTALVPKPGYKFCVADYSAVEARCLSFLAKEQWRIDSFAANKDIYCETASRMFGVPVVKHGINGELRQKGKQAELACIAEGQLVLTDHGLVPIEKVTTEMGVFDGEEFVHHEGVVYKGEREVMTYEGLTATPDHYVWVEGKQEPIQLGVAATCGAHLVQSGDGRNPLRLDRDHQPGEALEQEMESLLCANKVSWVRQYPMADIRQFEKRKIKRMSALFSTETGTGMVVQKIDSSKATLHKSKKSAVSRLWKSRHQIRVFQHQRSLPVFDDRTWNSRTRNGIRSDRHKRKLCSWESSLCYKGREPVESKIDGSVRVCPGVLALQQISCNKEIVRRNVSRSDNSRSTKSSNRETEALAHHLSKARLYDIRNAGPHHRFTVSGHLVHNCGYGGSKGALIAMGALEQGLDESELQPLVDSWRQANPKIVAFWWEVDEAIKKAVRYKTTTETHGLKFVCQSGMLFIRLPSGRSLSYVKPRIGVNQFGSDCVTYMGLDSTKHWRRVESYGPKFVENITQAICRDILCYAMQTLQFCFICAHVHDELIIECKEEVSLDEICKLMGRTPPWIPGLLLRADGYTCDFYQKD